MNHYGIAREAAAIYGLTLAPLDTTLPAAKPGSGHPVRIEAPEACGRFTARILRNVKIGPSQRHRRRALRRARPEAHPQRRRCQQLRPARHGPSTHAFDLDKIEGGILVRRARAGEKLKTLDGVDRVLDADDVVVADEKKALGLAGVMGGWDTMITPETKNILVEAAWFDPAVVRRMSRRHGIHSDASHRFERGADFHAPPVASALVSQLILAKRRPHRRRARRCRHPASSGARRGPASHRLFCRALRALLGRTERWPRHHRRSRHRHAARARLHALAPRRRPLRRHAAQLAARSRARDRPHRRGRARLRLQPLRQHAAQLLRHRAWSFRTRPSRPRCASCSSPPATTRPSPPPSVLPPTQLHSPRSPASPSPWTTRSAKRPACCALRSCPACSPCWPTTSTAMWTTCASSR